MSFEDTFREQIKEKISSLEPNLPIFAKYLESVMINLGSRFRNGLNYREFDWSLDSEELKEYVSNPVGWSFLLRTTNRMAEWFLKYSIGNYLGEITQTRNTPEPEDEPCQMPDCSNPGTEWDHILPHSWGGPNENWNFQLLCQTHNRLKSSSLTSFARKLHTEEDFHIEFKSWCEQKIR